MTMSDFRFEEICCPVCGTDDSRLEGWRGGDAHQNGSGERTAIVRCRNCSHQYPNPMPYPLRNLDEVYVDAEAYFHGQDVEVKKTNGLRLMKQYETRLGKRGRFLDVGCGAGELLWAARETGWDAEGVDPSKEFIEIGRKKLGVEGRVSTLEEAGYPENHFDAVAMSSIIEHLYDPYSTLAEVYRVLRPGGILFFDAPNEDGLYMRVGNLYMRLRGKDWVVVMAPTFPPFHVQGFNPNSLKTLLGRVGLDLLSLDIAGGVCEQRGSSSLRKKVEFAAARFVNAIGNATGGGSYMSVWAEKSR